MVLAADDVLGGVLFLAGFLACPTAVYFWMERQYRHMWPAPPLDPLRVELGTYRSARITPSPPPTGVAPGVVRAAAYSSFALGQMFAPGLLLALVGLWVGGVGVVGIPGLIVAWKVFTAGLALLRGDAQAPAAARAAAKGAAVLNVVVLVLALGLLVVTFSTAGTGREDVAALLLGTAGYAVVSLAQAGLLVVAAAEVERIHAGADAPVLRAEPA